MALMRPALLALAAAFFAACGGVTAVRSDDGGAAGDASVVDGAAGGPSVCVPGSTQSCYDGPTGTEGVGPCHGGTQTCKADGSGFGPCTGEVLPKTEDCTTPIDEDCDGHTTCGQLLWTKTFGVETAPDPTLEGVWGSDVAVDKNGDLVVAGGFKGTADFGNGVLDAGTGVALFVTKLDPSGNALWSHAFPISNGSYSAGAVAVDPNNNIVFAGSFSGTVDFGFGPLQTTNANPFVVKLEPDGNTLWSRSFGPGSGHVSDVAARSDGSSVLAGEFSGFMDLGGFHLNPSEPSKLHIFLAGLADGGSTLSAQAFASTSDIIDPVASSAEAGILVQSAADDLRGDAVHRGLRRAHRSRSANQ